MSTSDITPKQILDAIQRLPVDRRREALSAIEELQHSSSPSAAEAVRTGADLRGSPLIAIWADRSDVAINHEFAYELRRKAEHRI